MLAVVQRVTRACVEVQGRVVGEIGGGLLVLAGVHERDGDADAAWMAERIAGLRIFADGAGKMNLAVARVGAADAGVGGAPRGVLVIPNFTLCAQTGKGHRPSFTEAMEPGRARELYEAVCAGIRAAGVFVARGEFGAHMDVSLMNDGPVTILLDSAVRVARSG